MKHLFKNIAVLLEDFTVAYNKYVLVKNEKIAYIGDKKPKGFNVREYDGKNRLLMSGFYNAHSHIPMSLMRGYGENLNLERWLNEKIFPYENLLTGKDVYYGTQLGIAEMIKYGIVSTTDMYLFCDDMATAFMESGAKCNLAIGVSGTDNSISYYDMPQHKDSLRLKIKYSKEPSLRLKLGLSLHAEYTSSERLVKELAEHAFSERDWMHVHISETLKEHNECKERHRGMTPVQYLTTLGLFDMPVTAAHCNYIEGMDYDILKKTNATVATCPKSNLKLSSGLCDVEALIKKDVQVALGTDSVASNNNLSFIEEMRFLALIHKYKTNNAEFLTPKEIFKIATLNGALSQHRYDCGTLKEGNKADLIMLDIGGAHLMPRHDLLSSVLYSGMGSDVLLTMVDGKVLYENGDYKTLDIDKIVYNANKSNDRIIKELTKVSHTIDKGNKRKVKGKKNK